MDSMAQEHQFVELELLLDKYFNQHISPIMSSTKEYLRDKRIEEMKEYSNSTAGILNSLATGGIPMSDPYQPLKVTGEWNSKNTDDFLAMCKDKMLHSKSISMDLSLISAEWRQAVIDKVGRDKYDAMSKSIGTDLANAFIEYKIEDKMINRLVEENIPKSSADYIISKASKSSLLGLSQTMNQSVLDDEINSRGEAAYSPSYIEKGSAYAVGAVADVIALGGTGTWTAFAKFIGIDVGISMFADSLASSDKKITVEECVSKGIFGSESNKFSEFQKQSKSLNLEKNAYIQGVNSQLSNKLSLVEFDIRNWIDPKLDPAPWITQNSEKQIPKNIPLVIAPDQRKQYIEEMAEESRSTQKRNKEMEDMAAVEKKQTQVEEQTQKQQEKLKEAKTQAEQKNENGWGGFLSTVGLKNFSDIPKNLGYVIAMLPDIIVGLFTGKTKSLNMDNSMLPLASIVAGMFVRNPLLKTLLIGMGGLNLLNKVGQETLEEKRTEGLDNPNIVNPINQNYRQYPDEKLNSRISNPILQGNSLITTIDNVPYTIQLPQNVVKAFHAGALPLNTLANAVLAKSDQMQQMVSQNYEQEERETIVRTRGIQ